MGWGYDEYREYVPVAQKKNNAVKHAAQLAKKQGRQPAPVQLAGRKIAATFWGQAWCKNLEAYSDYANRLPRGVTYVRNGSVVDLVIKPRKIEAIVAGSETYEVEIEIDALPKPTWKKIKEDCSASIDSLLDLLSGRFSNGVMQRLTQKKVGLFPSPNEIELSCSCPDSAGCCKHLAAVMYGVGARLDQQPELLFVLRGVDHQELVSQAVAAGNLEKELGSDESQNAFVGEDLGAIFGIELDAAVVTTTATKKSASRSTSKPKTPKKAAAKSSKRVPKATTKQTKDQVETASVKLPVTKKKLLAKKKTAKAMLAKKAVKKRSVDEMKGHS